MFTIRISAILLATIALADCGSHNPIAGVGFLPSAGSGSVPVVASTTSAPAKAAPLPSAQPTTAPAQTPTSLPTNAPTSAPLAVQMSFYSYLDGGTNTIAYPVSQGFFTTHNAAGGTGTFSNPLTAASSVSVFGIGTKLYVPALLKYVVTEDSCATCDQDWSSSRKRDLRIWSGGDSSTLSTAISACQTSLINGVTQSASGSIVIPNPPNGLNVDTTPLFQAVPSATPGTYAWICYF